MTVVDKDWDPLDEWKPRGHRMSRRYLVAIVVVLASVAGLAAWGIWPFRHDAADRLVYPSGPGGLSALLWGSDGWIYGITRGVSATPDTVFRTRPGADPQVISANFDQDCGRISDLFPVAAAVGVALSDCRDEPTNRLAILSQADPATISSFLALPDPVSEVGWDGRAGSAYVSMPYDSTCVSLQRVGQGGYQVLDLTVPLSGTAIAMGSTQSAGRNASCGGMVRADFPMVSSRGDLFFMLEVQTSPGVTGWYLCLLPRGASAARVVAGRFSDQVTDVAISHSGDRILVSGTWSGQVGLWLVQVRDGSVTGVAPGEHFCVAFDPSDTNAVVDEVATTQGDADASTLPLKIVPLR
jgi:hypothetical protein